MEHKNALLRGLLAGSMALALAGCGTGMGFGGFGFGGMGNTTRATVDNLPPDARGVITYQSYQVAVAREGDALADIAARVGGTSAADLGTLNGLPGDYRFRQGEVVALPDSVPRGGFGSPGGYESGAATGWGTEAAPDGGPGDLGTGWSPDIATSAIENAPGGPGPSAATPPSDNPFVQGQSDLVIDPIRHRVEPGETVYSIARLYGVSVTALASWNGLGPDLAVRNNQELLIPVVSGANQIQSAAGDNAPGQGTQVPPPPGVSQPLPEDIVAGVDPASPNLGQYRTPDGGRLARPVEGQVVRDFNPSGAAATRSDGVVFSAPAGTPVNAAGDGEVALVSESLGGMGTIVLIRHSDDLMTVYGRVGNVAVSRGDRVAQGQPIGSVAPSDEPGLHFEVRRGTEAVDPMGYLGS